MHLKMKLKNQKKKTIILSLQGSSLAILISKFLGFKIIVRNAEDALSSTIHSENKFQSLIVLLLKIFLYNFSDKIITNSKGSGNSLKKFLIKKKKYNSQFIIHIFKKLYKSSKQKKKNILLSVGRLTKQKDFHNLIISFNFIKHKIPNYKLIIIGDGHLKMNYKSCK